MNTTHANTRKRPAHILIVEDDTEMAKLLSEILTEEGYVVETFSEGEAALERYAQNSFDLTITDLMMPSLNGKEVVKRLKGMDPDAQILVITAFGTIESAVETMRAGAFNYLSKPFRTDEILVNVSRALETRGLKHELRRLQKEVKGLYNLDTIVGHSPQMRAVFELIVQIIDTPANVLITGESGTGKEVVAKAIHYNSRRSSNQFVAINCAAIPETLLESELFGYARGAFTDAKKDRRGLFQEANGGTLFLDEISDVPITLQAKLLRAIQDKEVRPLGSNRTETVDVRILAATNRDLDRAASEGKFRQDLFYRLNVIRIELPPLRERREDIPLLVEHFIQKLGAKLDRKVHGVSDEALRACMNYPWPGNVRELEHTIERALLLCRGDVIDRNELPGHVLASSNKEISLAEALSKRYTLRELEWAYIRRVLEATGNNKTEAAAILGVDRTTLYRKIEEEREKGANSGPAAGKDPAVNL